MRIVMGATLAALATVSAVSAQTLPTPSPSPAAAETLVLRLICRGTGEHKVLNFGSAFAFSGNRSAQAFGTSTQSDQFGEQMDIDVRSGSARVRVPRRFLPPFHGGDGGWFDVSNLVVNDDEITGKVQINFAQHPNLRIDRRSGSVALDGKVGSFAGQCEKYDPTQHEF